MKDQYLSLPALAKMLGISRIAVYNRVKKGEIQAIKIGRNYAVSKASLDTFLGRSLSKEQEKILDQAVEKTVGEYGEVLKLLGNE
jgi:excisionase family DNA binding protein